MINGNRWRIAYILVCVCVNVVYTHVKTCTGYTEERLNWLFGHIRQ